MMITAQQLIAQEEKLKCIRQQLYLLTTTKNLFSLMINVAALLNLRLEKRYKYFITLNAHMMRLSIAF